MGGGGTTINNPGPSEEEKAYYKILTTQTDRALADKEAEKKAAADKAAESKRYGQTNWSSYLKNLQAGYSQGLYNIKDLEDAASKYEKDYGLSIGYTQGEVNKLRSQYIGDLDKKREVQIKSAFKDLLGRDASATELSEYQQFYDSDPTYDQTKLLNSLKSKNEYTSKLSDSYLEAYHDELYGKQETKTVGGKTEKTGIRTFNFNTAFDPTYAGDVAAETGIAFGTAPTQIKGRISEIEETIQAQRQKRQFMYDSGLAKLQGQIDKDVQKIKNEGGKDIAKIQAKSNLYGQLLGGFTFS